MNYTNANKPPPSEASSYDGTIPPDDEQTQAEVATERVATLVGDNLKSTDLFCQMDILRTLKDELVWKEMARWVRYEEAVEEGGERWSKPHVASLMMEALQDLQHMLSTCPVFLECGAKKMTDIADEVIDAWREDNMFPENRRDHFYNILIRPHVFQFLTKKETKMRTYSSMNLQRLLNNDAYVNGGYENGGGDNMLSVPGTNGLGLTKSATCPDSPSLAMFAKTNKSFMRKIPAGSESVNLLVGEIDDLDKVIAAFVRLKDASNLGDITEVALDTRFMFIILAPKEHLGHCAEMCRCMGALFTDEIFRCVAYRAEARTDILAGIQEFCLHLTVLPPGVWDPTTRIEPPDELPSQDYRKTAQTAMPNVKSAVSLVSMGNASENEHQEEESHADPTLVRTGKLFGGLINDVKRKVPYYLSDFKDALHIQCLASFFFLFLATLTPNVTFGGLLGQATDQYMGTMECILSAAISGVMFALFSGQPLNILGSTGPMLVLEAILYRFCKDQDWDFLPFRVWVGFWTALMILLIVAFDLSALVRFITRFTEESFACLIALIFIYQAFKKTIEIEKDAHVQFNALHAGTPGCFCLFENKTFINMTEATALGNANFTSVANVTTAATNNTDDYMKVFNSSSVSFFKSCMFLGGTLEGAHCDDTYVPDVFFFSLILFAGTFMLSTALHEFRHSLFFPTWVRTNVSDFAVLISIVVMVLIDALIGIPTPKLMVPAEFKPTKPGRPWFINPISEKNPWWLMILSAVPALLATILIFMDQQITAVIVNRKENKLKKGSGYHLDMLVVGVLVVILSLLGLPWYVAATVTALAHIMSLKKVSECTAPGEKPVFLGVREQRVTGLMVGIFSGLAVLITSVLNYVPMPVLYGVFLYMGVAPLGGMQLVQRILLVFMPAKYQPDYSYIRNVPIRRVHLFTAIQVFCLAVLWVVKSIKSISIGFPLMVLIICFIRKAMDKVFTQRELKWLDDILPAISSKPEEVKAEPILIKVTDSSEDNRKETQATEAETNVDEVIKDSLKPRMSITFVCKTGVDRIKEMAPSTLADRRKSLIMAVERKRSLQMYDGHIGVNRKISSQSMFERKYSHGSYGPRSIVNSDSGQYSGQNSHQGSTSSIVEEHNRQNKMLSLPATIKDENENDSDS